LPGGKLALGADGTVYATDPYNHRVRAIRTDGRIETLPDGFEDPRVIPVGSDGTMYVVDSDAGCVYRRDVEGAIAPIAGVCGEKGASGDNGLAALALLDRPLGLALDEAHHRLYIADTGNKRIRFVTLPR